MRISFFCGLLLFFSIPLTAQKEISDFEAFINRESNVSIGQNDTAVFMIFDYLEAYELVQLDTNMQKVKKYVFEKPDSLKDMLMARLLVQENRIVLFYQASIKDRNLRSLELALETKSIKMLPLDIPYEKEWKILRSFVHEEYFYLFRVHEKDHSIRIYKIDGDNYETAEYDPPVQDFYARIKEDGFLYIPLINYNYVLPKNNTAAEKLYLSDSLAIFSFEQPDSLGTQLFSIDLKDLVSQSHFFTYTDSLVDGSKSSANSIIYNGFIYQVFVGPKRKELNLSIKHIESGAIIRQQTFKSDEEIIRSFGTVKARKIKERNYKDRYKYKARLLPKMKGEIGLLLEHLGGDQMSFSMGFYRKQKIMPHEAAILGASIAFNLAFVAGKIPLDNDEGLSYDPFVGVFSFAYGIYGAFSINHRTYTYAEAMLDAGHIVLRNAELDASRSSKLNNYIHGQKLFRKAKAQLIFKRGDKLYYSFYKDKRYRIIEF